MIPSGISEDIKSKSFPAKKAAKSIFPTTFSDAPFIFNASVTINPLNPISFFKRSVTTLAERDTGKLESVSLGTFK